jgi:MFS family permease
MLQAPGRGPLLSARLATVGVAYAFVVTMIGTTLPTPLYPIYEKRFGFSALVVTLVFATYAIGVIAALLLLGQRSDQVGRRPVLLLGLVCAAASSGVFLIAGGLALLFVGRFISGLSAGIFTGTATAALVDFAPPQGRERATLIAAGANIGGLGLGPLIAGVLAQLVAYPLRVSYVVHLALLVPAAAAIWLMPEGVEHPGQGAPLRLQRLTVPREMLPTFVRAAAAGFAGFAVTGLFTAVAPSFIGELLKLSNHVVIGAVVAAVFAASISGQLLLEWIPPESAMPLGCGTMVVGNGLIAAALASSSLVLLVLGAVGAGTGMGTSFRAGLAAVNRESPREQRGEVASSFFVIAYLALIIPIVGVGGASQGIGLRAAGLVFSGVVAAIALFVMLSLAKRERR